MNQPITTTETATQPIANDVTTRDLKPGEFLIRNEQNPEGIICTISADYYVDENGEIQGIAVADGFRINSKSRLNWFLRRVLDLESELEAIKNSKNVIKARKIIAQADRMSKKVSRRREFLVMRFASDVREYVRPQLKGSSKTFNTIFGTVSFRTKKGGLKVKDNERAVEWAKKFMPNHLDSLLKVEETFLISSLPKESIVPEIELAFARTENGENYVEQPDYDPMTVAAFFIEPDSETMTVASPKVEKSS
jgi:phage host-nuclease inhibitor protein Gam